MELKTLFEEAVVNSKTLLEKPSNNILLQLYSLYKQATQGDANIERPTNLFDFVAQAKFTSWQDLKGKTKETAMKEYVDLIEKLKG